LPLCRARPPRPSPLSQHSPPGRELLGRNRLRSMCNAPSACPVALQTLRDRAPYSADQVVASLSGSFAFVLYDHHCNDVFVAAVSPETPSDSNVLVPDAERLSLVPVTAWLAVTGVTRHRHQDRTRGVCISAQGMLMRYSTRQRHTYKHPISRNLRVAFQEHNAACTD